ncbi:MAG: hypothetical protein HN936_00650, partial [Bacteroidetes bacterium]|nr:hypothetical protein [Bacteroidota bacterium]
IEELTLVYNERAKRAFTGSKWIIICSAGIGVLFAVTGGITTFLFLHLLGLLFYILSSRTPIYVLEKRMDLFGSWGGGMVSAIFEGLFVGAATKHYNVYSDGRRERDHSSEFLGGMAYFLIGFVIAMFLGVLAAVLGVVNFFLNYSTSYHMPFKSLDSWYTKEFDN